MSERKTKAGFYLELIRTLFQSVDDHGRLRNRTVVFTSATPGEGVSHVVDILAEELAAQTQNRVLRVDATALQSLQLVSPNQISWQFLQRRAERATGMLLLTTAPSA